MLKPLVSNGKPVGRMPAADQIRKYVLEQLSQVEI
jgi:hypothetical protein